MLMLHKLCLCAHKLCLCNINIVYVIFVQTAFHIQLSHFFFMPQDDIIFCPSLYRITSIIGYYMQIVISIVYCNFLTDDKGGKLFF